MVASFCSFNIYKKDDNNIVTKNKPYNFKNSIAYKAWGEKISDIYKKLTFAYINQLA